MVLQTILNVIDYGMSISEAVDAPRIHNQWLPDVTNAEPFALSPDTRKILEGMGHHFGPPQPANHVDAILVGAPKLGGKPVGGQPLLRRQRSAPRQRRGGRLLSVAGARIRFFIWTTRRRAPCTSGAAAR